MGESIGSGTELRLCDRGVVCEKESTSKENQFIARSAEAPWPGCCFSPCACLTNRFTLFAGD